MLSYEPPKLVKSDPCPHCSIKFEKKNAFQAKRALSAHIGTCKHLRAPVHLNTFPKVNGPFGADGDDLFDYDDCANNAWEVQSNESCIVDKSYMKFQEDLYNVTYGLPALNAKSMDEFVEKVNEANPKPIDVLKRKIITYQERFALSRSAGEELVDIVTDALDLVLKKTIEQTEKLGLTKSARKAITDIITCASSDLKLKSWKTSKNAVTEAASIIPFYEKPLPWDAEMQMDMWNEKAGLEKPDQIVIRCRNPIHCAASAMVNPRLMFGCADHIEFEAEEHWTGPIDKQERLLGNYMTSEHAINTQAYVRDHDEDGKICAFAIHDDGVLLDKGQKAHSNTVIGTLCIFSDELQRRDFAKFCLGYIPSVHGISKSALMHHLVVTLGKSKTKAKEILFRFSHQIDSEFWSFLLSPITKGWVEGVYLHVLTKSKPVKFYPYVACLVGDEPAQKKKAGCFSGNCHCFCVQCLFSLRNGRLYNPDEDKDRDSVEITALREEAVADREKALANCLVIPLNAPKLKKLESFKKFMDKFKVVKTARPLKGKVSKVKKVKKKQARSTVSKDKLPVKLKTATQKLAEMSLHPFRNPFDYVALGIDNDVHHCTVSDVFHSMAGGVIKSAVLWTILVIDAFHSNPNDPKFCNKSIPLFDFRISNFPKSSTLPHVPKNVTFLDDLSKLVNSLTKSEKGNAVGPGGGIRSVWWIAAALQILFVIGDSGDIVPNGKTYEFRRKVGKEIKTAKRASFTTSQTYGMDDCATTVAAHFMLLFELKQAVIGQVKVCKTRKIHMLEHFGQTVRRFGCLSKCNTETYETAEKSRSVAVYNKTSKRIRTSNEEMTKGSIMQEFGSHCSQVSQILKQGTEYFRTCGIQEGPDNHIFKSLANCRRSKLGFSEEIEMKLFILPNLKHKYQNVDTLEMRLRHKSLNVERLTGFVLSKMIEHKLHGYDIFLLDALKFIGSEDSGFGDGALYATPSYNYSSRPRYDYVLVDVIVTRRDSMGIEMDITETCLAQVLAFFEISKEIPREQNEEKPKKKERESHFFLIVQYLHKCEDQGNFMFPKYEWERNEKNKVPLDCLDIGCLHGTAFVIPYLDIKPPVVNHFPKNTDRFYYVERKFTDRSGWDIVENHLEENEMLLGKSTDGRGNIDEIIKYLKQQQSSSKGILASGSNALNVENEAKAKKDDDDNDDDDEEFEDFRDDIRFNRENNEE